MAHVLTSGEKAIQRKPGQWGKSYLAIPEYHVMYSAILDVTPASNDGVIQIEFVDGAGDISKVLPDMTLYVGSAANGLDLGMCRIRKNPLSGCLDDGILYIGEVSDIDWGKVSPVYLTVVDDYQIWAKPSRLVRDGSAIRLRR